MLVALHPVQVVGEAATLHRYVYAVLGGGFRDQGASPDNSCSLGTSLLRSLSLLVWEKEREKSVC